MRKHSQEEGIFAVLSLEISVRYLSNRQGEKAYNDVRRESFNERSGAFYGSDMLWSKLDTKSLDVSMQMLDFASPDDREHEGGLMQNVGNSDCDHRTVNINDIKEEQQLLTSSDILRSNLRSNLLENGANLLLCLGPFPASARQATLLTGLTALVFFLVGPDATSSKDVPWCNSETCRMNAKKSIPRIGQK